MICKTVPAFINLLDFYYTRHLKKEGKKKEYLNILVAATDT